jgi:hypothetical protein
MKPNCLHSTKDYTKFELCQFNRNVEKTKHLRDSMKKHGYIPAYPIHCVKAASGKLQIKAGHHRFEVAQELGIAVYYVVSNDDATIHELEKSTIQWSQKDFMQSFVRCGNTHYIRLQEFHERTGMPLGICIAMLSGRTASSRSKVGKFKYGEFVIDEQGAAHAEQVAAIVRFCGDAGIKANDSIFIQAVSRCLCVSQFSAETFKKRCESNVSMIRPCRTLDEQTELFELIYNRNATAANRLPLAFLANQAMATRNAVPRKNDLPKD